MESKDNRIITLTLNPSIDQIFKVNGLEIDAVNPCQTFYQIAAGKGINVSKYLKEMGLTSQIFAPMCPNAFDLFTDQLNLLKLSTNFTHVEGQVRTNTTIIDSKNNTSTHIKCKGFNFTQSTQNSLLVELENFLNDGDVLLICGSYPLNFDFDRFNVFLAAVSKKNIQIYIDNDGMNLKKIANPFHFFLKPNKEEFESFVDKSFESVQSLVDYLRVLKGKFDKLQILITLGKEGILYCDTKAVYHCKLKAENIVSSVGCGDAALAGFIYGKSIGKISEECLKLAAAFAVSKLGTEEVGTLVKEEIQILVEKATVDVFF